MKKYARVENGLVTLVIDSEVDPDGINGAWIESGLAQPGWHYNGVEFYAPAVVPTSKIITKLEYMNRFTDAELVNIYAASKSVIQIEIWLDKFKIATEIDLIDPLLKVGLDSLVAGGLLAANRVDEILQ